LLLAQVALLVLLVVCENLHQHLSTLNILLLLAAAVVVLTPMVTLAVALVVLEQEH
jgi:hypothetical protein